MPPLQTANRALARLTGFELRRARRAAKPAAPRPPKGPQPRSEPGSRKLSMFFDDYPRFYETSITSPYHGRLNSRYDAIFAQNRDILEGARVLDIASHDGRWSFAALQTGASHVVGIEGREDLVANANENLRHYGIADDRFEFLCGDVHKVMAEQRIDVDVVMCLGFLYHTLRYNELLKAIRDINPRHLIIDTVITPRRKRPLVALSLDKAEMQRDAVRDDYSHGDRVLVGTPSVPALKLMLRGYDFRWEGRSDWGAILRDNPGLEGVDDYRVGRRITGRAISTI